MELSSSIYLFLKSNIKGNKPRRSSDTVLCNSDLYKNERGILKEMRLTELSNFEDNLFFEKNHESLISRNSLSYSHNSLNIQTNGTISDVNDNILFHENDSKILFEAKNLLCEEKNCQKQMSKSLLFNNMAPGIKTLSKSALLSVYNVSSNKNSLTVPNIGGPCKLPFKLKSNVNSRKSSLIEEKQKSRRFKSAPNSRQKKDQSAVFSISTKEKSHEKSLIQYCKTCNSKRNDFKSNAL